MTSANRSSEPIAYEDDDAPARLAGLADAFLVGERPIARRVDDSVVRVGRAGCRPSCAGPRGYAPGAVAALPIDRPVLARRRRPEERDHAGRRRPGVRQPAHRRSRSLRGRRARSTRRSHDLLAMYGVRPAISSSCTTRIPEYARPRSRRALDAGETWRSSTTAPTSPRCSPSGARGTRGSRRRLDGTGYGDDGTIWGGELFVGSVCARASSARAICGRPRCRAATRRRVIRCRRRPDFSRRSTTCPTSTRAPFDFAAALRDRVPSCSRADCARSPRPRWAGCSTAAAALLGFTRADHLRRPGGDVARAPGARRRRVRSSRYPCPLADETDG